MPWTFNIDDAELEFDATAHVTKTLYPGEIAYAGFTGEVVVRYPMVRVLIAGIIHEMNASFFKVKGGKPLSELWENKHS